MSLSILEIQTPRVFAPLLQPARYKGAWGGRASGKSHFFAEMMVERALMEPGFRGAAIREIQKSTKLSVKQLIEDKIRKLGVSSRFEIRETEIRTPGDGLIIFQGMQDHTADSIKSLEGFDVAWCEEAQSLSDRSVKILRPTFRKPGSELWFSWNPENPEAPVDKLLRGEEHDDGWQVVVEANWRDNPWFGEEMEKERQRDLARDPDTYGWIWEGEYLVISDAQIFRNRVSVEPFETPVEVDRFFFGADWGFAMDPTALIRCFIRDECLYIDHEAGQASVEIDEIGAKVFDKVPGSRDWPIKADRAAVPVAQDTDILAMMVQTRIITTRQQDALSRLAELYWGWKSRQKVTTGYGGVKGGSGGVSEHVEAAYRRYNALMAHVPKDCKHAVAVAASGDMPVFACSMELLRRGATALADHLQLAKETGTTS